MPPARTPTAILKLTGSWRAKAREKEGEPMPALSTAEPPEWLERGALAEWNRLAPGLIALGVLTVADRDMLALYCEALADCKELRKILLREGRLIQGDRGMVKNPAGQLYREASLRAMNLAKEFGFTPVSRARVRAEGKGTEEQSPASFAAEKDAPPAGPEASGA